ncbi:MAG TPA: hypothetical protein PKM01_06505 [Anaerolineaceae bacterium]|nr:hypothetical protein [Anaerolineaceae bacterium]
MSKLALGFGFVFLVVITISALALGLTSASANLVQAQANTFQAQANATQAATGFVDKCLSGFLFVVVLFAGIGIGVGAVKVQGALQYLKPAVKTTPRTWAPGPNARWQKINVPIRAQLSSPQPQPFPQQQVLLVADVEEEDDLPLQGWGF